jgi:hypothetical protein
MIRRTVAIFLAIAGKGGSLLAQQPAILTGRVVDAVSREPIPSAEVRVGDEYRFTTEEGRFRTGPIQPGKVVLAVKAVGYSAQSRALTVLPGQTINLVFELPPVVPEMESISVVAGRAPSLGAEELATRGGDLATALNGWQGIVVSRTGHGNEAIAQVRGSAADEVLVLVDGFALNDPFTGRADLSRIPLRDIEAVSLLRGTQAARAGSRAVAGVLEISSRHLNRPELMAGAGTANSRKARVAAGTGSAGLSLSFEALPNEFSIDTPGGGEGSRTNAGGEIWSLNGRARLGADWTVRGSMSDRGLPGTSVNPTPNARGRDRSLLIGARTGTRSWVSSSFQWLDTRAQDPAPPPGFITYDNHTWGWGGTLEAGTRRSVAVGKWTGEYSIRIDGRHDRFDGDAVRENATFSQAGSTLSASITQATGGTMWTISPATRLDWFSGRSTPLMSGRLDLYWRRGTTGINASVGNGVTVPALADLLFRDGVGVAINPDLRPERVIWEIEGGFTQSVAVGGMVGSIKAGGFYGKIEDMILWTPNFSGNIWRPGNFAVRRVGGESDVELRAGDLLITGSAVFSRVTYDIPGGSQVPYRPRFSSSAHASWTPGAWRMSAGWNHLGTRFSRNRELHPLAPFDLFQLVVGRTLGQVSIEAEIRDITDARPVYIKGFPSPGRTLHLSLTLELP